MTIDPQDYIPGVTVLNSGVDYLAIPMTLLDGLTNDDVIGLDGSDSSASSDDYAGDIRRIMFALLKVVTDNYDDQRTAVPATNPSMWTAILSTAFNNTTQRLSRNFFHSFYTGFDNEEIIDEP